MVTEAAAAEEEEAEAEAEAKASLRPGLEAMQRFQEAVGVAGVRPDLVAVRAWLRGLPPAQVKRMLLLTAPTRYLIITPPSTPLQVKRMLLSHMRQCRSRRCAPCLELRERIRSRVHPSRAGHESF